ncbi:MAG: ATP12 family protein [Pseudomonadota bacterium]
MKVFWSKVELAPGNQGYGLLLDGRPVRTPAKTELILPTRKAAEAAAEEWRAQTGEVRPSLMPLTRAANTTLDRVIPNQTAVGAEIASYGHTDLLCYRAPHPLGLAERQAAAWDPLLAWADEALGAPLRSTEGIVHCLQPHQSLDALSRQVDLHDPWELTALHDLVTLSGSLVIGLAVSGGRISAEQAWPISRIDELWNIEEWGEDAEAAAAAGRKQADFLQAEQLLSLLRG